MKIVYIKSTDWKSFPNPSDLNEHPNQIVISYNNWDDYSYKTTLNLSIFHNGKSLPVKFSINIALLKNSEEEPDTFTGQTLNNLLDTGAWNGIFPIPNFYYISLANDMEFYSAIKGCFDKRTCEQILQLLHDSSWIVFEIEKNPDTYITEQKLLNNAIFDTSFLRNTSARKTYREGWLYVSEDYQAEITDFQLNIDDNRNNNYNKLTINFSFYSTLLPYDINILIGSNGCGKSFAINELIEQWLNISNKFSSRKSLDALPKLAKVILTSYSLFEDYRIDLSEEDILNKQSYKYFGFRLKKEGSNDISISRNLPTYNSAKSIFAAISDDIKYRSTYGWLNKFDTLTDIISSEVTYNSLALEILEELPNKGSISSLFDRVNIQNNLLILDEQNLGIIKLFFQKYHEDNVTTNTSDESNFFNELNFINFNKGVLFLDKNHSVVPLSSGQRLFCYHVINIIGEIKFNTLILIDEPELFLHPIFEIKFIELLKNVLTKFRSKAILATHSLIITREIPAKCVHVFLKTDNGFSITHPPFETFGADVQRISSYVFGDASVTKPFNDWLYSQKEKLSKDELINKLKLTNELNEEVLMEIMSLYEN